jgi:hypothetical protein
VTPLWKRSWSRRSCSSSAKRPSCQPATSRPRRSTWPSGWRLPLSTTSVPMATPLREDHLGINSSRLGGLTRTAWTVSAPRPGIHGIRWT